MLELNYSMLKERVHSLIFLESLWLVKINRKIMEDGSGVETLSALRI